MVEYLTPDTLGYRSPSLSWSIAGDTSGATQPPLTSARPGATGRYHVVGRTILDPEGYAFIPRGVNVGAGIENNGNGWPDLSENGPYIDGQKAFGCTAVRIVQYATSRQPWSVRGKAIAAGKTEAQANAEVDAVVDRLTRTYRNKGMVVIMECHDLTQDTGSYQSAPGHAWRTRELTANGRKWMSEVVDFWRRYASRWKHDSGVWFNIANEPNLDEEDWHTLHREACEAIRYGANQADNIIVLDAMYYASDLTRDFWARPIPRGFQSHMFPQYIAKYQNIVGSQHNYGSHSTYINQAAVSAYYDEYVSAEVPLMVGEVGFPVTGQAANSGSRQNERDGAYWSMEEAISRGIGVFWWASAFNDAYRLYDVAANNSPIKNEFDGVTELNEAGLMFKSYLTRSKATDPVRH